MRGYRAASITKYKGDKAKKEFEIDNSVELNRIRDKYAEQLTTEDNKKILPNFFAWISRQKGYYDPQHKAYLYHDTSMDYLQTIVRKFKTKARIEEPTSKLIDVFDSSKYDSRRVNHKQVSHIMKYVMWYATQVSLLFDNSYYAEEENINERDMNRFDKYQLLQNELIEQVNQYKIGYSTMMFIIKQFEKKEYYRYRNILLPLLFTLCRESFIQAVAESRDSIDVLVEGGVDLFLYDFGFKVVKNDRFLTKKHRKCRQPK